MTATTPQPVLAAALPAEGIARWAALGGIALLGSLVIALAAKVQVPFWPVPATLQTLAIFVIAATGGSRVAVATVGLYLAEGFVGLPVFAGAAAGPAYMLGGTGGYLLGFLAAAAVVGLAADRGWGRDWRILPAMLVGEALILGFGVLWLAYGLNMGLAPAFAAGVGLFVVTDAIKIAIAAVMAVLANRAR